MNAKLTLSNIEDVNEIVRISKLSFHSDISVGGDELDGPPDYDSISWHEQMQKEGKLYSYWLDDTIIGAAILWISKEKIYIGRIFIDPLYFHRHLGVKLMELIEELLPNAIYKLDTPVWNVRTNQFYKKCGYKEIKRDKETVNYQKDCTNQLD